MTRTKPLQVQFSIIETLGSALARPVNTLETVVGVVVIKIVDGRFQGDTAIQFALSGLALMFAETERRV